VTTKETDIVSKIVGPVVAEIERLCKERDAAIRERDAALARVAELEAQRANHFADASKMVEPAAEPVASRWEVGNMIFNSEERAKEYAEASLRNSCPVVPLFRSPPQPRGWLTEEERGVLRKLLRRVREDYSLRCGDGVNVAAVLDGLLARNAPPKVRMPSERACENDNPWAGGWNALLREVRAALAAAGVEVEE
jgi:hypothetical protein